MATIQPAVPLKTLRMSDGTPAEPIIDNPKLKPMVGTDPIRRRIGGKILAMTDAVQPVGGTVLMKAVPTQLPVTDTRPKLDQTGLVVAAAGDGPKSVRLRLRIVNGQVSVIGVRVVPGVLPPPERLDFGLAYEVKSGTRRVALGSIPDVGMRRSYPDPEGRPGMQGHHLQELESIEVNLRLPQRDFSAATLGKLTVQLFRMKSQPPAAVINATPLVEQFRDYLRPVAELRGIDLQKLPPRLAGDVRAALFTAGT